MDTLKHPQTEKEKVRTYYKKNSKKEKVPYYQINLSNKTIFKDEEVILLFKEDYNNLMTSLNEYNKLNQEHNILTLNYDKLNDKYEGLKTKYDDLKSKNEANKKALQDLDKVKTNNTSLINSVETLTKSNKEKYKVIKVLYAALISMQTLSIFQKIFNYVPPEVQKVLNDNNIKELGEGKE